MTFIDCFFEGVWDGNLSAKRDSLDPAAAVRVEGNGFRSLGGVSFYDGVRAKVNQFDLGGQHLILRRGAPG